MRLLVSELRTVRSLGKHEDSKIVKIDFFFVVRFYGVPVLRFSWTRQLSLDLPADVEFLCGKVTVLGETIK